MAARNPALALLTHFNNLEDPRVERTRWHKLLDIVGIAICAVICGAEGWEDIARYGRAKHTWLATFLELPRGIPCADTFRRVFNALNPTAFQQCFQCWIDVLTEGLGLKRIAIDGKTARRSFDRATGKAALHLVSAWATEQHLVLGQVAVDSKSNEITAIPKLLELLDVSGAIVTIDAMGCQKEIAAKIREGGGDYVLTVKDNQGRLLEDIRSCFAAGVDTDFAGMEYSSHEEQEHGHGRSETRSVHTILHPEGIRDQSLWQDLQAITMIVSEQQVAGKEASMEVRYYIGSKAMQAAGYARAIRGHWGIENGLHWVLDMSFAEDQSRIRKEHGPENFALLRRLALSLIKRNRQRGSVRGQRLLLMRYPKLIRANSTRDQLVLNVDMAPTLLDLAGTAAPTDMHGASLLPLLKGDAPKWRTSFLAEYFAPPHNRIPAWQAVRTTQWKYIHYTAVGEMDELYDLAADRYELKNVIHEPGAAGVLKEMRTALERLRNETP